MSQESTSEAIESAPEELSAPAEDLASVSDDFVDDAVETSEPSERGEELSLAEAFAQAKAELGTATPDADGDTPPASSEQVGETPPASDDTTSAAGQTSEPFDINALREALETGNEANLPVEGRQVVKTMRERFAAEQAQERAFKDYYLELAREAVEDPDAYIAKTKADPRIAQFVHSYEKANPDVTLESPEGNGPDPARMRAQIDAEYVTTITDMAELLARDNGVDNFAAIRSNAGNKVGVLLQTTFNEAVKKGVAKELPALLAQERLAITAELTAKFAQSRVMTPRGLNGTPVNGSPAKPSDPDENPLRASFEEAKLELAKR